MSNAEVKASSPIRTSLYEREGSMRGNLKRPSLRRPDTIFPYTFKALRKEFGIPEPSSLSWVVQTRSDNSDVCHEMLTTFGFTKDQMHRAAERYHLGRSKSGQTIYWMIDDMGRCFDGRLGDSWVSTMLKARYPTAAPYLRVQHCLFGLHQLGEVSGKRPIGLVESERSAVILSELYPKLLWMAYSYGPNFTVDKFEPLQGHKVTLYPLTDPYMDNYLYCIDLADRARNLYDLDISVSHFLEDNASPDQKKRYIDLLDFILDK